MNVAAGMLRLLLGLTLAWWVTVAVTAPELTPLALGAVALIAALTLWRPGAGLIATAALTPAGALLVPPAARGAELLAAAFGAAWLLALWRPLAHSAWPRTAGVPALLYAAAVVASWLGLTVAAADGVSFSGLAPFVFHAVPSDHLVFSSPEPQTWVAMQTLTAVGLFLAGLLLTRDEPRLVRWVAHAIIASAVCLALATFVELARQWSSAGYEIAFLARYRDGERFALHVGDLNAAGSWYALAAVAALALSVLEPARRVLFAAALAVVIIAIWLTGSRSAYVGVGIGALVIAITQKQWRVARSHAIALTLAVGALVIAAAVISDWRAAESGSAAMSARLRSQFLVTTVRMFASAPLFGVGVGRYYDRSAEFMTDELRTLYGFENAHNYFAQQFAEGGLLGGLLFLWVTGAIVVCGWRAVRDGTQPAALAIVGGVIGYLSTCFTGHPLLVPEAALPFWIAAGVVASGGSQSAPGKSYVAATVAAVTGIAAGLVLSGVTYARTMPIAPPSDYGFHQPVTDEGATFRWMVRHGVTYVPNEPGFLRLRVRAPQETRPDRPLILHTAVGGWTADRREVPSDRWVVYDIPVRPAGSEAFQRVDLRVNQWWQQESRAGTRRAVRPIAAMVADIRWIPLSLVGR